MNNTTTTLRNKGGNWITGTVNDLEVQAKCYDEPSHYGIDQDGRISKLWIRDRNSGKVLYNYDRCLDFDGINPNRLTYVVEKLGKVIDKGVAR